jgi:hypothetical protein
VAGTAIGLQKLYRSTDSPVSGKEILCSAGPGQKLCLLGGKTIAAIAKGASQKQVKLLEGL